jgi:hypothetical protein
VPAEFWVYFRKRLSRYSSEIESYPSIAPTRSSFNKNSRSHLGRDSESGGTIKQIARDAIKDGRVIKLDTPKYLYDADLLRSLERQ